MKHTRTFLLAAGTCIMLACNNNKNDQNDKDSISKESAISADTNVDTAAMNNGGSTGNMKPDSNFTNPDSSNHTPTATAPTNKPGHTTAMVKPNPAKKGHKGSVRVAIYGKNFKERMEADKNGVYNYAEILPSYPGGQKELDKFVQDNIQYPQDAIDNGVEGTVTVKFAVDESGKVYSPQLANEKLGYGLDEEALSVINKMPKWSPGRIKGKNVKTYYDLPITFALQ